MEQPDLIGNTLVVIATFCFFVAILQMCGCGEPGWPVDSPCRSEAKNLSSHEGEGEYTYITCEVPKTLTIVEIAAQPIGVCTCPPEYFIDAGTR